jgi:hypothetical protein
MSIITLTATLPSEFVSTATVGTSADWLVIQKSGENYLRKIPASASAFGAANLAGYVYQNFSAANLYMPPQASILCDGGTRGIIMETAATTAYCLHFKVYAPGIGFSPLTASDISCTTLTCSAAGAILLPTTASIWCSGNQRGIQFNNSDTTIYGGELKVYSVTSGAFAPIIGDSIYCATGGCTASNFRFTADADTGISRTTENILNITTGGTTQAQFLDGELASKNVRPLSTNTYALGNASYVYTGVWATDTSINTSDARRKADITDCDLGLDFIAALRPVSYRWQEKVVRIDRDPETLEDVPVMGPGIRRHYSLIAQDVKALLGTQDFAGYIYDEESDIHALRLSEFIAPLIKAVQEERAARLALEARIAALE